MTFPFDRIRHLLIDLDGVLYRGNTAIEHAAEFVTWLRRRGIVFRLVTNNATLTPQEYVTKLASMGIEVGPDEVFTSALATSMYVQQQRNGAQTAYAIGEDGLLAALEGADVQIVTERPDWVVVGLDRHVTYEKLAIAALAIESGARFLGTNPDPSLPTEQGLVPGAGAIQAALVATTGVQPTVIGKPQPLMLELAIQRMNASIEDTAMLGDRLDTDIRGANGLGMSSILVLTGVSTRADLAQSRSRPDVIVDNLAELIRLWESRGP
jgi:4-nitrophenyl phosphatase